MVDTTEAAPGEGRRSRRRRPRRKPKLRLTATLRTRIGIALLGLAVVGSALAVGAVHTPSLVVIAALVVTALLWIREHQRVPAPSWVAFGLSGFSALQAVPIPVGVLRVIAPRSSEVWLRAIELTDGHAPSWAPISLDPGASMVEALKWFTYGVAFYAASILAKYAGTRWAARVVVGSALLVAAITISHGLVGATHLYGFYQPSFTPSRWGMGPLLNTNNLAGYLNMGILCGLALLFVEQTPALRWVWGLASATLIGTSILSASRGGLLVLPVGLVVMAVLARSRRPGSSIPRGQLVAVSLTLAAGVCLAIAGATRGTWRELFNANTEKLEVLAWSKPLIRDHAWVGVGRGAFDGAFPAYSMPNRNLVFSHAENVFVQWAAEWGVPVAAGAFVLLGWLLGPWRFRPWRPMRAAAWATLVVLVLHNLFDLGLEVPAVMLGLVVILGANWGDRAPSGSTGATGLAWPIRIGFPAAVGVGLTTAAIVLGLRSGAADRSRVAAAHALHESSASLQVELRKCVRRHPADPYFPRLMALLVHESGGDALPWLGHALERDLRNGRAHLLLARVLRARGAIKQALLELRLAADSDAELVGPVARHAIAWAPKPDDLLRAVPDGVTGSQVLVAMSTSFTKPTEEPIRTMLLAEAITRNPGAIVPRKADAQDLLRSLATDTPRCAGPKRERCVKRIREHADSLAQNQPSDSAGVEIRARLMSSTGDSDGAERLLAERCASFENAIDCMRTRFDLAISFGDTARLETALKDLLETACPRSCAKTASWAGDTLARNPRHAELALSAYRRAAQTEPTLERLVAFAELAGRTGRHAEAVGALDRAMRMPGADDKLKQRLEQERAKAMSAQ